MKTVHTTGPDKKVVSWASVRSSGLQIRLTVVGSNFVLSIILDGNGIITMPGSISVPSSGSFSSGHIKKVVYVNWRRNKCKKKNYQLHNQIRIGSFGSRW